MHAFNHALLRVWRILARLKHCTSTPSLRLAPCRPRMLRCFTFPVPLAENYAFAHSRIHIEAYCLILHYELSNTISAPVAAGASLSVLLDPVPPRKALCLPRPRSRQKIAQRLPAPTTGLSQGCVPSPIAPKPNRPQPPHTQVCLNVAPKENQHPSRMQREMPAARSSAPMAPMRRSCCAGGRRIASAAVEAGLVQPEFSGPCGWRAI